MAGTPRCAPGCGCGKHRRSRLTQNDLSVLARVFGFPDATEFAAFVERHDEAAL